MSEIQGFNSNTSSTRKQFIRFYLEQILDYLKTPVAIHKYKLKVDKFGTKDNIAIKFFASDFMCDVGLEEIEDSAHYKFVNLNFARLLQGTEEPYSEVVTIIEDLLQKSDKELIRTLKANDSNFPTVEINPAEIKWHTYINIATPVVSDDGISKSAKVIGNTYSELYNNASLLGVEIIKQLSPIFHEIGTRALQYFSEGKFNEILDAYLNSPTFTIQESSTNSFSLPEVYTSFHLLDCIGLDRRSLKDTIGYRKAAGTEGMTGTDLNESTLYVAEAAYNLTYNPANLLYLPVTPVASNL